MQRKDAHDDELDRIAQRLRAERPQLEPLRRDAIKTAAMSQAQRSAGSATRRRLAVAGLTVGLMAATTGGVIAAGGASQSGGNAATAQYAHGVKAFKHHKKRTRVFHIHLHIPYNARLASVTVKLDGKTVLVLTGRGASRDFQVTLPCGSGTVKIIAVTSTGRTFTETRLLLACGTSSHSKSSSSHGKSSSSGGKSTR